MSGGKKNVCNQKNAPVSVFMAITTVSMVTTVTAVIRSWFVSVRNQKVRQHFSSVFSLQITNCQSLIEGQCK